MRELILLSILALTSCASASYVRYQRDAANVLSTAPTSASNLAVKIVLEEQNEHGKIENHYIKQMDSLTDTVDVRKKDLRDMIVKKAEAKEVLSISLQLASCAAKNENADDKKECVDNVRRTFLGPKPEFGVAPEPPPKLEETEIKTDDPKLLKRILQIFASKRESLNLLKSELNLVQGLAKLLTGEALDDELEIKIETAALLENAKRKSRETVKKIQRLVTIAMEPEVIPPKPVTPKKKPQKGPSPWDIYKSKLHHAAYNDTAGLGPNEWNPTRGDRMDHEDEEIDERDENYDYGQY